MLEVIHKYSVGHFKKHTLYRLPYYNAGSFHIKSSSPFNPISQNSLKFGILVEVYKLENQMLEDKNQMLEVIHNYTVGHFKRHTLYRLPYYNAANFPMKYVIECNINIDFCLAD